MTKGESFMELLHFEQTEHHRTVHVERSNTNVLYNSLMRTQDLATMEESDETDSESDHETVVIKEPAEKWYLIRNRGRFIQTWNLVIVIFAVYNSITQPLYFAWNIEA